MKKLSCALRTEPFFVADFICQGWERRPSCKLNFKCDETSNCVHETKMKESKSGLDHLYYWGLQSWFISNIDTFQLICKKFVNVPKEELFIFPRRSCSFYRLINCCTDRDNKRCHDCHCVHFGAERQIKILWTPLFLWKFIKNVNVEACAALEEGWAVWMHV